MRIIPFMLVVTALLALVVAFSFAEIKLPDGAGMTSPPAEVMAALQKKYGTPGAEQDALKALVGAFDAELAMRMDPSAPVTTSRGKMVTEMILDGRFLLGGFKGEFMGQPFDGMSVIGFDKIKGKYTSFWINSMSTAMMNAEGSADASGKVITLMCTYDCPLTQTRKTNRQVMTIVNDDNHLYEVYEVAPDGREVKSLSIRYARAK